ncbi:MAG: biotin carboxyl carrier protein [Bacteroidia bacterium]|jgi:biotin carboxyl carrier protein
MFKALVNGSTALSLGRMNEKAFKIDDQEVHVDILPLANNTFHLVVDNASYNAELISVNHNAKTVHLLIEGESFTVELKDEFDQMLKKMGMGVGATQKINEVKAPMPGLVLSISVKSGQQISKGEGLMVLEAMKMENVIVSPCDATIDEVVVAPKDKVDKNQILITFIND